MLLVILRIVLDLVLLFFVITLLKAKARLWERVEVLEEKIDKIIKSRSSNIKKINHNTDIHSEAIIFIYKKLGIETKLTNSQRNFDSSNIINLDDFRK